MGQMAVAEPLAEPGETVVSPEAWPFVAPIARGTPVSDLLHSCATPDQNGYMRIDWLSPDLPPPPPLPPVKLRHRDIPLLRRYIPAAVQPKLKAGHDGHLAEMRSVSVLFVKCESLNISADETGNCAMVPGRISSFLFANSPQFSSS